MKKLIKQYITAGLLVCFVVSGFIYYACLDISEIGVKISSQLIASGDDFITETIKVPARQFNKKEIRYHDHLYDVHSYQVAGDSVIVTVYHDEMEEKVLSAIASCFEINADRATDLPGLHHIHRQPLTDPKIMFGNSYKLQMAWYHNPVYYLRSDVYFSTLYCSVVTPPPKAC